MIEITSSGIAYGVGIVFPNFIFEHVLNYLLFSDVYNKIEDRYMNKNFGMIDIEWEMDNILNTKIILKILDE